jgi:hypothetical protein
VQSFTAQHSESSPKGESMERTLDRTGIADRNAPLRLMNEPIDSVNHTRKVESRCLARIAS